MAKASDHPIARTFLRGLAILLPVGLTAFILVWLWQVLSQNVVGEVATLLDSGLALLGLGPLPAWAASALAAIAVFLLVLLVGFWLSGVIGRTLLGGFEKLLARVPLVGAIYPHVKQITEFFFGEKKKVEFERVVGIPYPRKEIYSLAFLTGNSLRALEDAAGEELVSVFVPSSPMPVTGYTLFVPARDIVQTDLSVDEAFRTVISGGVLVPPEHMPTRAGGGSDGG